MPWFVCGDCGDSIKKPKIVGHVNQCSASSFTCLDCSRTFTQYTVKDHTSCVTEHEKYAQGATKPGGTAAAGYFNGKKEGTSAAGKADRTGLASRAPWRCSLCNATCTSEQSLLGHATGAKHIRRARAANAAAAGPATPSMQPAAQQAAAAQPAQATTAASGSAAGKRKATDEAAAAASSSKKKQRHGLSAAAINGHVVAGLIDAAADVSPAKTPKQQLHEAAAGAPAHQGAAAVPANGHAAPVLTLKQPSLKKHAIGILKSNGGSMRLRKLQKAVRRAAGISEAGAAQANAAMMAKWAASLHFHIDGKTVCLTRSTA